MLVVKRVGMYGRFLGDTFVSLVVKNKCKKLLFERIKDKKNFPHILENRNTSHHRF